jgi:hypothetical protein
MGLNTHPLTRCNTHGAVRAELSIRIIAQLKDATVATRKNTNYDCSYIGLGSDAQRRDDSLSDRRAARSNDPRGRDRSTDGDGTFSSIGGPQDR